MFGEPFFLQWRWLLGFARYCTDAHVQHCMSVMAPMGRHALEAFDRVLTEERIECAYTPGGYLEVCSTESGMDGVRHEAEIIQQHGYEPELIDGDEVRRREPALGPDRIGAVHHHESATLIPSLFLDRLAAAVIDEHFPRVKTTDDVKPGHKLPTFRVHYEEHSAAMHLHKIDVEKKVADMVPSDYEVNLNDPTLTILVSVAGGSCMMSVVQGYASHEKFHHFHIHSASDLSPKKGTGMPASVWTQPGRAQAA